MLFIPLVMLMAASIAFAQSPEAYTAEIMKGLSNHGTNVEKPYITAGDRTYIVGTQNGDFPDLGSHVPGEMGGVWRQPIKLLDGFWVKLTNTEEGTSAWLKDAKEFVVYPYAGKFLYEQILNGIRVERFQYCPQGKEGIVVRYTLTNGTGKNCALQFDFATKTDLSPVWYSIENNIIDAADSIYWDAGRSLFEARDLKHPWFAVWGSSLRVADHTVNAPVPIHTIGLGVSASTSHHFTLKPDESMSATFVIAGSNISMESALAAYDDISKNHDRMLNEKQAHYASIIDRAAIEIPDKKLQQAYTWGKINTEWLVSDLPGIGRFLGAGAIEYPWLFGCDNSYADQGVVATGEQDMAKSTLRVIKSVSEKFNGNGRIIHEMSSNGFVGNTGNTQETAHFAVAVWKVFEWTGDVHFLKEMYPYIKQGIHWLLTDQDINGNMFPEGYGIMEVRGLNAELIDVAVYTQQALEAASRMAGVFNEPAAQAEYARKAAVLKEKINALFWDESEGSYCDFYGTREQAIAATKGAIEQLHLRIASGEDSLKISTQEKIYDSLLQHFKTYPVGTQKGWITNNNWVISTPMETGIAPRTKAVSLLNKVRTEHTGEYGPYLSAVEKGAMMTIATGVQAMAEAAYGRTDEAMWYVDKIVQTFGRAMPGSISEMMPDYGCPVQAWTMYGLALPLVTHVFGIQPHAYQKTMTFAPHLPSGWNDIKISELPVGSNAISFAVKQSKQGREYHITSKQPDWKFLLTLDQLRGTTYVLNGITRRADADTIQLHGSVNSITILK
jgi:glycogen debranching enzyme